MIVLSPVPSAGTLRERFIADMTVRGFSAKTQHDYLRTYAFTEAAIAAWKAEVRKTRGGQPRYSGLAIATALTLRTVFRLAVRQT